MLEAIDWRLFAVGLLLVFAGDWFFHDWSRILATILGALLVVAAVVQMRFPDV